MKDFLEDNAIQQNAVNILKFTVTTSKTKCIDLIVARSLKMMSFGLTNRMNT